jgi:hypothetical protein
MIWLKEMKKESSWTNEPTRDANYVAGYWIGRGYDDVVVEEISK